MKQILLAFCILFFTISNYENSTWGCTVSKKNVNLFSAFETYDSTYKPSWQIYNDTNNCNKIQKAFLSKLVNELDLDDYPFQISIWVDEAPFQLPYEKKGENNGFSSIGYKASNNKDTLEIIFQHPLWKDSTYQYSRIYTLVKYAVENIDLVKQRQKKMTFRDYWDRQGNERYISVSLLDTNLIKSIPTEQLNFDPEKALKRKNIAFPISIFAALIGAFVAIFAGTAAKRKNAKT